MIVKLQENPCKKLFILLINSFMSTVILQEGERLLLELRPNFFFFFWRFFMGICFMGLPFFFFFGFWQFGWIGRGLFFLLFFLGARFTVRQWKRWKKILYRI